MGTSPEEIDAAVVRFIKPLVEEDPNWMKYYEAKANPPTVSEILKQYYFVQDKVDDLCDVWTPIHWDGAPNVEIEYVSHCHIVEHIMLTLNCSAISANCFKWNPHLAKIAKKLSRF